MKYDELGKEYLVFRTGKCMLGLALGEYRFYYKNEQITSWKCEDDVYRWTIDLLNAKTPEQKAEIKAKIENSNTYKLYNDICKEYSNLEEN